MKKAWILFRSLVFAIALAFLGAYLNELGAGVFPKYEKYVDNVVAVMLVVPLIYLVFVPAFAALSGERSSAPGDRPD